jgi:putative hydrolases of HD superfamily
MQTKSDHPAHLLRDKHASALITAYFEVNQLKQLYRQGWLHRGLPLEHCESVAEHTFGVLFLAMAIADAHFPELDLLKVMRLALLHDFGEIYAGDIVPADHVDAQEKYKRERESALQVLSRLPDGATYVALWQEYEDNLSPEARFVKQLDRLEMGLQAMVYELRGHIDAGEFLASTAAALVTPVLREVYDEILSLR